MQSNELHTKRIAAEIKRFVFSLYNNSECLDRMVGENCCYIKISYAYALSDIERLNIGSAELFKLLFALVCGNIKLIFVYFHHCVGV